MMIVIYFTELVLAMNFKVRSLPIAAGHFVTSLVAYRASKLYLPFCLFLFCVSILSTTLNKSARTATVTQETTTISLVLGSQCTRVSLVNRYLDVQAENQENCSRRFQAFIAVIKSSIGKRCFLCTATALGHLKNAWFNRSCNKSTKSVESWRT